MEPIVAGNHGVAKADSRWRGGRIIPGALIGEANGAVLRAFFHGRELLRLDEVENASPAPVRERDLKLKLRAK